MQDQKEKSFSLVDASLALLLLVVLLFSFKYVTSQILSSKNFSRQTINIILASESLLGTSLSCVMVFCFYKMRKRNAIREIKRNGLKNNPLWLIIIISVLVLILNFSMSDLQDYLFGQNGFDLYIDAQSTPIPLMLLMLIQEVILQNGSLLTFSKLCRRQGLTPQLCCGTGDRRSRVQSSALGFNTPYQSCCCSFF